MGSMPGSRTGVLVVGAFASIYFIWGSTYLAIHLAIETLPPFLMAAVRFLLAGTLVYCFCRLRGTPPPSRLQWFWSFLTGTFLLGGGNGGLVWAQQYVPSGVAALVIASVPFWMVLLEWISVGRRPSGIVVLGLAVGFLGVGLLTGIGRGGSADISIPGYAMVVLLLGSFCWSVGSLITRHGNLPASPFLSVGMQMVGGGLVLLLLSGVSGEFSSFQVVRVSSRSLIGFFYLLTFGSILAFSAYVWLLRVSSPARVATYAFVNPAVAVLLGWLFLSEAITAKVIVSSGLIVTAVILVTFGTAVAARSPGRKEHAAETNECPSGRWQSRGRRR